MEKKEMPKADAIRFENETCEDLSNVTFYVNEKNLGYLENFSKAISLTNGDYVALSDQDDIWTQDHIEKLVRNIGNKAICVADCMMVDSEGLPL